MGTEQLGFEANIAPELAHLRQPIGKFTYHPDNARKHNIGKIQQSLVAHGQRTPIVVQASTGFVCKGNGTLEAARGLGWLEIAADLHELSDDQAYAYCLADNRASDQASYDAKKLIAGLEKMVAGPGLADTLFELDDLEDLIAQEDAVPAAQVAAFTGGFNEPEEQAKAREEAGKKPGDKRVEVPLLFTKEQHVLFVGWLKTLQKKWNVTGTFATVYAAVKRQAEAEDAGTVTVVGEPLTEEVRVAERRSALNEFLGLILSTGGPDREFRGLWLIAQLEGMMYAQKASKPVAGGSTPAPVEAPMIPFETVPEGPAPEAEEDLLNEPGLFEMFDEPTPEAAE